MSSTLKYRVGIWLIVLLLISAFYFWRRSTRSSVPVGPTQVSIEVDWKPRQLNLDDYELVERSGRTFKFSELDRKVWAASFFFGQCPGPCKLMNNRIAQVRQRLGDEPVTFVSISVDPKNDTPERMREYAEQFAADEDKWLFVTGDAEQITRLARELLAGVGVREEGERDVAHSEKLIPIDRAGLMHYPHSVGSDSDVHTVVRKLRELLETPKDAPSPTQGQP